MVARRWRRSRPRSRWPAGASPSSAVVPAGASRRRRPAARAGRPAAGPSRPRRRRPPAAGAASPAAPVDLGVEAVLGPPPGPQDDPRPAARRRAGRTATPSSSACRTTAAPTSDTIGSAKDVRFIAEQLRRQRLAAAEHPRRHRRRRPPARPSATGMAWLAEKGRPGTFSLFHYSGHVKQHGGGTESLWPVDRDCVRDTRRRRRCSTACRAGCGSTSPAARRGSFLRRPAERAACCSAAARKATREVLRVPRLGHVGLDRARLRPRHRASAGPTPTTTAA